MNWTSRVLHKIAEESNGNMKVEKVPPERQPTTETQARIERIIKSQIASNDAMRHKSYINASERV